MRSSAAITVLPPSKLETTAEVPEQLQSTPRAENDHFFWTYTEEPHRTRRQAIIKAHPEVPSGFVAVASSALLMHSAQVTKLCGPEPLTKYIVAAVLALQIACAYLLRGAPVLSWRFCLTAYVVGATANQNLFLAIHEISHNLAFRSATANRLFAIFANLPIGIPYSASFRVSRAAKRREAGLKHG